MTTIKKVQQTPSMCGPASLVSLLDFYGIQKSEAVLAQLCHSTEEYGTSPQAIVRTLQSLGFTVHSMQNGAWSELQRLTEASIPVLINWWSDYVPPADGHYSVVYEVTNDFIHVMDPEIGNYRRVPKQKFLDNWYDFIGKSKTPNRGWYLYIESR